MKRPHTTAVRANFRLAGYCASLVVAMASLAYAAVPLYDLFCRVTGYGGTTQRAEAASDRVVDRTVTVRFDANTARGIGWDFKPGIRSVTLKLGETARVSYSARNTGAAGNIGTSTFNVTPPQAGAYFNKLECFCFTRQMLAAGETVDMPVQFFISPDMADDDALNSIGTITLSYTFFPVDDAETVANAAATATDGDLRPTERLQLALTD